MSESMIAPQPGRPPVARDQRQRFLLLEARVIWAGSLRVGDLRDAFGITTRKAEKDFARYRELCPDNLVVDLETGIFRADDRFEPAFLRGSAEEFLGVLRHHDLAQDLPLAMAAAGHVPAESLDLPQREFDVRVLHVPLYRYEHWDQERWESGCLQRIESHTDDDGQALQVQARRDDTGLDLSRTGGHASQ